MRSRILNRVLHAALPKWQRRFTEIWAGCLGLAIVLSLPSLYYAFRARQVFTGFFDMWEGCGYAPTPTNSQREVAPDLKHSRALGRLSIFRSVLLWSPLGIGLTVSLGGNTTKHNISSFDKCHKYQNINFPSEIYSDYCPSLCYERSWPSHQYILEADVAYVPRCLVWSGN